MLLKSCRVVAGKLLGTYLAFKTRHKNPLSKIDIGFPLTQSYLINDLVQHFLALNMAELSAIRRGAAFGSFWVALFTNVTY